MAEKVKKATTTRKPSTKNAMATVTAEPAKAQKVARAQKPTPITSAAKTVRKKPTNGKFNEIQAVQTEIRITHEQIAALAHRFWEERGQSHGNHEEDWRRAEQALLGKAS